MNKIYTKTGDRGITQLADGTRVAKDSDRINACGAVDELNAFLGLALIYIKESMAGDSLPERITRIQRELLSLNSQLSFATQKETITMLNVQILEQEIDEINSNLPSTTEFILPGDIKVSAVLHVVRTVCRRAERAVVKLRDANNVAAIPYLNRLSDWLFVAARFMED